MSAVATVFAVSCSREQPKRATTLQRERQLNQFFAEVERRALRFAEIAVRDRDEALDIVQDAMIKLARNYAGQPSEEWTPLFYRILQNRIPRLASPPGGAQSRHGLVRQGRKRR